MRAVFIERHGGPEVLRLVERPDPEPGQGQLLVRLAAAGVNYRDVYERESGYGQGSAPMVVGAEGAGTVVALGPGVERFGVGDRVAWSSAAGSYAELVAVDQAKAVPVPDGVPEDVAAAALLQGMTAHYLCTDVYPVREADAVLVHAGAGGVGLLLIQLVKLRGGRVITTTSTAEKAELARGAGADETIGYEGFATRVRELTGGEGVAAVYDGVGRTTFDESLASLRPRGTLALFGAASGPVPPVDPARLMSGGSLFLTRPSLIHYAATREELLRRAGDVFGLIGKGKLEVRIGARYPLAGARQAHEDLEARRTAGKLLLVP